MILQHSHSSRRGATIVEMAVVGGVVVFLIFAFVVGATGIFRYQEVAHLAREGARYASTHGGQYQQDGMATKTGVPAISSSSDLRTYLLAKAGLLDPSRLQITVTW